MQKKYLAAILFIILCIVLNVLFAGALMQKTNEPVNNIKPLEPTVRMVSSFLPNATIEQSILSTSYNLVITNVDANYTSNTFLITILNNGSSQITLSSILVNGYSSTMENNIVIPSKNCATLLVDLNDEIVLLRTYEIQVYSLDGNSATFFKVCC